MVNTLALEIQKIRSSFPALSLRDNKKVRVYLDNPAGTQVPLQAIERMKHYLIETNANHDGHFRTSRESDQLLMEAHQAMADFLNARSASEIIFGPNMTTLTFAISRSLAHWFKEGEEIIVTRMDHDANVMPWVQMAQDNGLAIKWLDFNRDSYQYDMDSLENLLSPDTRLIAVNYASNAIGTINDIKKISQLAHRFDALVYVDAVQYVPHAPTDVQDLGCDFLVCSAYKFFGPHQGILWGKSDLLGKLPAYKVRPADEDPPGKFETGTQCHEGQAGTLGALEYFSMIGKTMGQEFHRQFSALPERSIYLHAALAAIRKYEKELSAHLINGLQSIKGIKIHGITDFSKFDQRVPTVSFVKNGHHPADIARRLAEENVFVWDGDYYAVEVINHLGLQEKGGMLRVGPVHYNTIEEVDSFLNLLELMK
jgi:cysteine desulfurase family protein (TIGR01976 family)